MVHQYVRDHFGDIARAAIPSYETLRVTWRDWFGPGGGRQRYVRSAAKPVSGEHTVIHRPGQAVALDTTLLPVTVRESAFGELVSPHLTLDPVRTKAKSVPSGPVLRLVVTGKICK